MSDDSDTGDGANKADAATRKIPPYLFGPSAYGAGLGLLTAYPQAAGDYWAYFGRGGTRTVAAPLRTAIANAGMTFRPIDRVASALPRTSPFYANNPISRLGNNAMVDAANTVRAQYGRFATNIRMDLSGVRGRPQNVHTFLNGQSFRPDLTYRTWSPWSGATAHFDEVKAVANLTASSENLRQVRQYGRAISETNTASAGMRRVGAALRGGGLVLGGAGAAYDAYSTYGEIKQQLAAGDTRGARLSGAQFVGREGGGLGVGALGGLGGVLAGAALFGEGGALAGTVAPGVGNVALGVAGAIVGGVIGGFVGEKGITALYDWVAGAPKSDAKPTVEIGAKEAARKPPPIFLGLDGRALPLDLDAPLAARLDARETGAMQVKDALDGLNVTLSPVVEHSSLQSTLELLQAINAQIDRANGGVRSAR
jgi:hypothetical protein